MNQKNEELHKLKNESKPISFKFHEYFKFKYSKKSMRYQAKSLNFKKKQQIWIRRWRLRLKKSLI